MTEMEVQSRSWAWGLGWLGVSGPVLLLAGNVPTMFGPQLLPWASILLDIWCAVSVLLSTAAVVFARDDAAAPLVEQPRFRSAGLVLGAFALAADGCLLLLWLFTPMSF